MNRPHMRLLVSTLTVSLASIALLGLVSSASVRGNARRELTDLADSLLENAGTQLLYHIDEVRNITYQMHESGSIRQLFQSPAHDPFLVASVANDMRNTLALHDYLDSLYLGTPSRLIVARSRGAATDESLTKMKEFVANHRPLRPLPRALVEDSGPPRPVLTMHYHEGPSRSGEPDRFVVANIDVERLSAGVLAGVSPGNLIAITDEDGFVLAGTSDRLVGRRLPVFAGDPDRLLAALRGFGHLPQDASLVRTTQWREGRFHGCYVGHSSLTPVAGTAITAILLGALAIVVAIAIVVLRLSKTLYRPISDVFDAGAHALPVPPEDRAIPSLAERIVARFEELQREGEEAATLNRGAFLRQLLLTRARISEEVVARELDLASFTTPAPLRAAVVMVLRVDSYREHVARNTITEIRSRYESVCRYVCDRLSSFCEAVSVDMSDSHIAVLCISGRSPSELGPELGTEVGEMLDSLRTRFGLRFTAGLSDPVADLSQVRDAYRFALDLTGYRVLLGGGRLITAAQVEDRRTDACHDEEIEQLIAHLADHTRRADSKAFRRYLEELVHRLGRYDYESVVAVASELAYKLLNLQIGDPHWGHHQNIGYVDLYEELSKAESMEELAATIIDTHDRVASSVCEAQREATRHLCEQCVAYVAENYRQPLLSAATVAEKLGVSPQYFSGLFHRATGKSFPQYLNDLRLDHAYRLLREDPKLSVSEACRAVGYNSRNHFTALFKAKFALTPSDMRRRWVDAAAHQDASGDGAGTTENAQ